MSPKEIVLQISKNVIQMKNQHSVQLKMKKNNNGDEILQKLKKIISPDSLSEGEGMRVRPR